MILILTECLQVTLFVLGCVMYIVHTNRVTYTMLC